MRRLTKKSTWLLVGLAGAVTLSACGADPVDETFEEMDMDPPQINYLDEDEELDLEVMEEGIEAMEEEVEDEIGEPWSTEEGVDEKGGAVDDDVVEETAMSELYLVDRNGLVAPQTFNLPASENDVAQKVSYLIQGGPISEMLPNGFQAVLPPGTEVINATVNQGVATINFNEEFADYRPEHELQVLQSLTWTVTQMEGVDRVRIQMDGEDVEEMPQRGTPIVEGYTRAHGINLEMSDHADISSTTSLVVYFLAQDSEQTYYVPVTRRVDQQADPYEAVMAELLKGPDMMSNLLTDFRQEVELVSEPVLQNGTLTLNFNEAVLSQMQGTAMSENVLNMIVLSMTEQNDVENVSVQVDSESTVLVSTGETLTEPVSRPSMVNTGEY
ncbi:GerMN domain-containing protein [Bacillus shivajii]|uniref:GerMN domain-containing protein n=1 Tax=Bacillus shivajii TaxID=1983719 RepID=UPI001CFBB1FF|nr:GerMN domain-containing protein [Bacillus shivajii]UCZ52155.1 GerMN domain-containing protein [Bacillus shivajii]